MPRFLNSQFIFGGFPFESPIKVNDQFDGFLEQLWHPPQIPFQESLTWRDTLWWPHGISHGSFLFESKPIWIRNSTLPFLWPLNPTPGRTRKQIGPDWRVQMSLLKPRPRHFTGFIAIEGFQFSSPIRMVHQKIWLTHKELSWIDNPQRALFF